MSKWERGASFPNVVLLIPIAECLGVSVTELLMGEHLDRHDMIQHDDVDNMGLMALMMSWFMIMNKDIRNYLLK